MGAALDRLFYTLLDPPIHTRHTLACRGNIAAGSKASPDLKRGCDHKLFNCSQTEAIKLLQPQPMAADFASYQPADYRPA